MAGRLPSSYPTAIVPPPRRNAPQSSRRRERCIELDARRKVGQALASGKPWPRQSADPTEYDSVVLAALCHNATTCPRHLHWFMLRAVPKRLSNIACALGLGMLLWPTQGFAAPATTAPGSKPETHSAQMVAAQRPPRIDGAYLGLGMYGAATALRVNDLDTPGAFAGGGGYLRFGQMVLPWLGLGLQFGGGTGVRSESGARQTLGQGGFLVDLNFLPARERVPGLSLRTSFGFGAGAVREAGQSGRSGFGGALFGASARYELFPGAMNYRPTRGGGFGIGPELGWLGATPAARGRPLANTFYLALSMTFYFGS